MAESPSEFQLKNPPTDGITAVKFGPNSSQLLLTSSWDTSVRLYDVVANHLRMKYNHPAPVLDCCFHVSFQSELFFIDFIDRYKFVYGIKIPFNSFHDCNVRQHIYR